MAKIKKSDGYQGVSMAYRALKIKMEDVEAKNEELKNQIESSFVGRNSRVVGIAESLANYHMYYGDADLINTEIDRFLAVTKEDLQNVAKKYYNKNNRVVLHYLPHVTTP